MSCSGDTCSITLGGNGSQVHVLGTSITLEHIRAGRATLRVDHRSVTCSEGHEVTVGRIELACTAIDTDAVQFTATRT